MLHVLKSTILFGALMLGLSGSAAPEGAQTAQNPPLSSGGIYIVPPDHSCGKYAISLSPGGHNLVAWHPANPRILLSLSELADDYTVAAFDTDCLLATAEACQSHQFYVTSPTIHTLYWAEDGRTLFVINADGLLFSLTIENGQIIRKRVVGKVADTSLGRNSFSITTPSPAANDNTELDRLTRALAPQRQASNAYRKTNLIINNVEEDVLVGERADNLDLELSVVNKPTDRPHILSAFTGQNGATLPVAIRSGSGHLWLIGDNNISLAGGVPASDPERQVLNRHVLGSWPIIDADTGLLVGLHDERSLSFFAKDAASGAFKKKIEAEATRLVGSIISVSVSSRSGRIAFSLRRLGQGVTSEIYDTASGRMAVIQSCPGTSDLANDGPVIWNGGKANWPLPMRLYRAHERKGLVIYLHGGPASSSSFDPEWSRLRLLLDRGYDVITIDPSGATTSTAQAKRLSSLGGPALDRDAELAAAQIDKLTAKYSHVSLLAESFGGAWAPSLYRQLKRKPERVVLAAPLVRYVPPIERQETPNKYAALFERYYILGSTALDQNRFPKWLERTYAQSPFDNNTLIVQGEKDRLSQSQQLPNGMAGVRVLVPGGHLDALSGRISRQMAACWLTSSCDATNVRTK